jgi:hypothetical protein
LVAQQLITYLNKHPQYASYSDIHRQFASK